MPPHSQGAERQEERRGGRTGSRWGLRALVVGGLAVAAWLLAGAAAQAAEQELVSHVLSAGSPVLGAVTHGARSHDAGVVQHVVKTADESSAIGDDDRLSAVPKRVVSIKQQAGPPAEPVQDGFGDADQDLTAPDRHTGEAEEPVTELPPEAVEPVPLPSAGTHRLI